MEFEGGHEARTVLAAFGVEIGVSRRGSRQIPVRMLMPEAGPPARVRGGFSMSPWLVGHGACRRAEKVFARRGFVSVEND